MNRKINYILASKGGVGKSTLTYEWALYSTYKNHNDMLFVDLDNSTQTSTKQLKFLGENQLETISLLNEKRRRNHRHHPHTAPDEWNYQ